MKRPKNSKRQAAPSPAPYGTLPPMDFTGASEHPEWQRFVYNALVRLGNEIVAGHGPETYRCFIYAAFGAIAHGDEQDLGTVARDFLMQRYTLPWALSVCQKAQAERRQAEAPRAEAGNAEDEAAILERWFRLDSPGRGR